MGAVGSAAPSPEKKVKSSILLAFCLLNKAVDSTVYIEDLGDLDKGQLVKVAQDDVGNSVQLPKFFEIDVKDVTAKSIDPAQTDFEIDSINKDLEDGFVNSISAVDPADMNHADRSLKACYPFTKGNPHNHNIDNKAFAEEPEPWTEPQICKLFIDFPGSNNKGFVCTGTLVGPSHLLTSRHCTMSGCLGLASRVRVACGYGYTSDDVENAKLGTVELDPITCISYKTYDEGLSCRNGESLGGNWNVDIQVCRLDRKIGDLLGYFSLGTDKPERVTVKGYPGVLFLNDYIYKSTKKRLTREAAVTAASTNQMQLSKAYIFDGESGAPYFRTNNQNSEVLAVHTGGPDGCAEYGTRLTRDFIDYYLVVRGLRPANANIPTWLEEKDHCQIINYQTDLYNFYRGPLKGVGVRAGHYDLDSVNQSLGGKFGASVTLYNLGTKATTITLKWYASFRKEISQYNTLLGQTEVEFGANTVGIIHTRDLEVNWRDGVRYIGVIWEGKDCLPLDKKFNKNVELLGKVRAVTTPRPTPRPTSRPTKAPTKAPTNAPTDEPTIDDIISDDDHNADDDYWDRQDGSSNSNTPFIAAGAVGGVVAVAAAGYAFAKWKAHTAPNEQEETIELPPAASLFPVAVPVAVPVPGTIQFEADVEER